MPTLKTKTTSKNEKAKTPAKSDARIKPKPIENLDAAPSSSPGFAEKLTSFWWDLAGVFLLALGFVLLLGGLGFTHGILLDAILHQLAIWFGIGCLIIPIALLLGAWLLLSRERQTELDFHLWRVILVELGVLSVLGSLSAFARENILIVEAGESLGGSIGWGLAHPLVSLIGWVPAGILLAVLSLILFLYGFNIFARVETWARKRASVQPLVTSVPEGDLPTVIEPVAAESSAEVKPAVRTEPKPKTQASLPREYKQQRLELVDTPSAGKPLERSKDLPPLSLLEDEKPIIANQATINTNAAIIEKTLQDFGIPAKVVGYRVGPSVTQYAVEPGYIEKGANEEERQKVRIAQISSLSKDLALALKAERLRIEAPVPGKSYVGIEIPNAVHTIVRLRPILESENFTRINSPLAIPLGRDVSGQPLVSDLTTMPHLLIAGATNSGKSICIAAITTCLVMNNTPEDLRLVMIDPKMVELTRFNGLPHLLGPVETDVERIKKVLQWAVGEMEARYKQLETAHARNLDSYNTKMQHASQPKLPRLVILVDELADLMLSSPEETERALVRLAQKARAVGIHLIIATQRPSIDVVTGVIKANFPTRIAFTVASSVDSRVILDTGGAETLLGKGDMLFLHPEVGVPQRSQGVLVSDQELKRVISWWQAHTPQDEPQKVQAAMHKIDVAREDSPWEEIIQQQSESDGDEVLIDQAIKLLRRTQRASASYFQRQLHISYPRAAWLIDALEERGIIGPAQGGGKNREVFLEDQDRDEE